MAGPIYDGKYLRQLLQEKLGDTKLHQALTNIAIPTYDIKLLRPTIFSTYMIKDDPSLDANLRDICIGTSAAPTYLPAHYFETQGSDDGGGVRQFNLIDGGVAANNPALVALTEVSREVIGGGNGGELFSIRPLEYNEYIVLSLGTGTAKEEGKYSADQAANWGILGWFTSGGCTPLIDVLSQASSGMVDYLLSAIFQIFQSEENYLRIQDDLLTGDLASVDVATPQNLQNLVEVGENLLKKPVSVSSFNLLRRAGAVQPLTRGTNEEALKRLAKRLSQERRLRNVNSPKEEICKQVEVARDTVNEEVSCC